MIKKTLLLLLFSPIYLFAWKMEGGEVVLKNTLNDPNWTVINLKQAYDNPPLIFAIASDEGGQASALRLQEVNTTAFKIMQVEPNNDGKHVAMTIHYVAIEEGEHTLPDGTKIIAGTKLTSASVGRNDGVTDTWETINFSTPFSSAPVVLGMIQTLENESANIPNEPSSPWLTTAITNVSDSSFNISLERSETNSGTVSGPETIAYLAIDAGVSGDFLDNSCNSIAYETFLTPENVEGWDNGCNTYNFSYINSSTPNVVATKNTRNVGDGGWLRRCSLSNTSVGLTVDEDITLDAERSHTGESAGVFVTSGDFVYDSTFTLGCGLVAEYRMDECYWLGSGTFDIKDTVGVNDGEAYNSSQPDKNDAIVNFSGGFSATGYFQPESTMTISNNWTMALWIKFPLDTTNHDSFTINGTDYFYHALGSISGTGDLPAILIENGGGGDIAWELYDAGGNDTVGDLPDNLNGWHQFIFVQSNGEILLYLDGDFHNKVAASITGDIEGYLTSFDNHDRQTVGSKVDELKLWSRALSSVEITSIASNESVGNNYDGSIREAVSCNATVSANSWELVGVPIDLRNDPKTVIDTFQGMNGAYGTDWRVYRRDYSDTNNSSWYTYLASSDNVEFGKAYWLGNKLSAQTWNVNGTQAVDYNSSFNGTPDCVASRCVEIDVKSVSVDFATEPDDGTGPYRYNMTGFVGKSPVKWADCRFIIDGTAYTPTAAEEVGYASKKIWKYNGNDYDVCEDTVGTCLLEPYKGFWIELHGKTKGKTVKLLIPQE